jgi:hypothetical protein
VANVRKQNARPMEGIVAARLGKFVACLAGSGRMIQIAPQIRILVAVEAIDGRKGIDATSAITMFKLLNRSWRIVPGTFFSPSPTNLVFAQHNYFTTAAVRLLTRDKRSTCPGAAPVYLPSSITIAPFTIT